MALLSRDRKACTAPFCFWKENCSTTVGVVADRLEINWGGPRTAHWSIYGLKYGGGWTVSQSDGVWPPREVAPLPNEGISYCRIGMVGLWPWYRRLCLRQVL